MKLFNLKTHWLLLDDQNYNTTSNRLTLDGTSSRHTREVDSVLNDNPKSSDTCSDIPTNNKEEDDDEGVEPCYDQFFDNSTINGRHTRSTESDDDLGDDLVSIFELLDVHVGSQVVVGRRLSEKRFHLIEVYKNGPADKIKTGVVGVWEGQSRVRVTADYVTSRRRGGVDRKTLRAAVVITTNYTIGHLLDIENKHIDAVVRLNYNLLIPAMEMVNASLEVLHEPTWGYNYNGSWNGIVGRLQRGEADIAGTSMFLLSERLGVIDFTVMTLPTKVGFLFRQPPLSSVRNIFTLPFDGHVWACCVALITLCGIVLYYTLRWERREDRASQKASKEDSSIKEGLVESTTIDSDRTVSWSDVVLLSLGAVCQQGSPIESHGPSGRIASLLLFVVVIFLYTSYSASIVVLLQSTTGSIRTLKDLLESPLGMGVEDIVYTRYLFKNQSEPVHKAIYNKKIAPPGTKPRFMDIGKGMEMMRKGFFAFHIEASSGYKIILETFEESEKCGITLLPYIGNTDNYLSVRKGSPYRELVTVAYRKLQERGFQQRALNRYYTNKPECTARDSSFVSVGLIDFYPAILVLVYGLMPPSEVFGCTRYGPSTTKRTRLSDSQLRNNVILSVYNSLHKHNRMSELSDPLVGRR
uniref:Uncharacterized protein n=1 Tax=Timema monikensis TaxID=170555 RepID=A0A7R9EHF8_9NEOP|nr:unnamed protein product [Timema monikensis]